MALKNIFENPHEFRAKGTEENEARICVICGHGPSLHLCEKCEKDCPVVQFMTMRYCQGCYQEELALQEESAKGAEARVEESRKSFIERAARDTRAMLDETITIRSDYFNADIPSVVSIRETIFATPDKSSDEKQFEYTRMLRDHIGHMRQVLIDMRDAEQKIGARMKLMQAEINNEANKLREEERKVLQLENINYTPTAPKTATTPKAPSTRAKAVKLDMKEVEFAAKKYGIPEQTIMATARLKKLSVDAAAREVVQAFARAGIATSPNS